LKEGLVRPDGIELTIVTGMDSTTRHWRFLRNREFDVAEVSASSYIVGRDKDLPFRALPVFLHRRFRHGFIFINTTKGITKPTDLIGRRVGVKSYQVTAILWLRGILEREYGVPHQSIEWLSELDEDVAFTPPAGLKLSRIPDEKSIETMLADGEITFFGDTRYSAKGRAMRTVLDRAGEQLFRAALKMPVDVYEGPAMNHSYHEMIIGHGGCFSTILAEETEGADYHRAQYLATQMALAERGRAVVSITLRDLGDASLRALDEFFRQAAMLIRRAK